MNLNIYFILFILSFGGNNVLAQTVPDSVLVLPLKASVPANAIKKGSIKAGNNATDTHCDYEAVIAAAKEKARAMGGNIVKITALVPPAFISKCYRIKADVYYTNEVQHAPSEKHAEAGGNKEFALLYIYRLPDTTMLAPSYNLHLNNDSVICFIKNRSAAVVRIYKEGALTLWAKTQHRGDLKFDVKFGAAYYIRCGVTGSQFSTTPVIEKVTDNAGAAEYTQQAKRRKDSGVKYLQQIH